MINQINFNPVVGGLIIGHIFCLKEDGSKTGSLINGGVCAAVYGMSF